MTISTLGKFFGAAGTLASLIAVVPLVRGFITDDKSLDAEERSALAAQVREVAVDARISVDERLVVGERVAALGVDREAAEAYLAQVEPAVIGAAKEVREGLRLTQQARFEEARRRFEEATRLDAESTDAWTNLGGAALEVGAIGEAEAASRRALELDPRSVAAHYNLGACLARQERTESALDHLARALDLVLSADVPPIIDHKSLLADLRGSEHFASLRTSPAFEDIVRRLDDASR